MTTETPPTPDPQLTIWAERLESDLVEAGMESPEARAFGRAFELGLAHALSQCATKQDLRQSIDDLRREMNQRLDDQRGEMEYRFDDQRREMSQRFEGVNQRFEGVNQRFDDQRREMSQRFEGVNQRFDGVNQRFEDVNQRFDQVDQRFKDLRTWVIVSVGLNFSMLTAVLVRVFT